MTALCSLLVLLAGIYTVHRAWSLEVEYYDGYAYLANARRLAGDEAMSYQAIRPPAIPLLLQPAVRQAMGGEPANRGYLRNPQLTSALLSLLAALAIFWLLREPCGTTLALVGVVALMWSRVFIRYGAMVMTDIPAMGWAAATVACYVAARSKRSWAFYGLCGLALGSAVLTKYTLGLLGPTLLVAEGLYSYLERRIDVRRWLGLFGTGVIAALLFAAVHAVVFTGVYGSDAWARFLEAIAWSLQANVTTRIEGSSWTGYGAMLLVTLTLPVLALGLFGLFVALKTREPRDVPFLAWMLVTGGGLLAAVNHPEIRYLFPVVPPLLFFALRGVEFIVRLGKRRVAVTALLLAFGTAVVYNGGRQAWFDRQQVFTDDLERRATRALLAAREPGGRLWWLGHMHNIYPEQRGLLEQDPFFNIFHFPAFAVEYMTGEKLGNLERTASPSTDLQGLCAEQCADGDAVIQVDPRAYTIGFLPDRGVQPIRIWSIGSSATSTEIRPQR